MVLGGNVKQHEGGCRSPGSQNLWWQLTGAVGLALSHTCYCCTIGSSPGSELSLPPLPPREQRAQSSKDLDADCTGLMKSKSLTLSQTLEALRCIIAADRESNRLRERMRMWHRTYLSHKRKEKRRGAQWDVINYLEQVTFICRLALHVTFLLLFNGWEIF